MVEPRDHSWDSKQDYGTPWSFIFACERKFGQFDVDLAARSDNAKAPLFVSPEEDSLRVPWSIRFPGKLAWLNPEFPKSGLGRRSAS